MLRVILSARMTVITAYVILLLNFPGKYSTDISTNTEIATTEETKNEGFVEALKEIAYYLRAHKFNEYDRRYETNPVTAPREYYKEFPRPPLRSIHWEVNKYCETTITECIVYLSRKIRLTSSKRADDTAIVMYEHGWSLSNNSEQIRQVEEECQKLRRHDDKIADPFEGPLERFQWRVAASYYMCWYAMKGNEYMEKLSDRCDNFANCLNGRQSPGNFDLRANDSIPYACALYSFCPDPCCQQKYVTDYNECWESQDNPCSRDNPKGQRECNLDRSENTEFTDIILNRWNVSCKCPTSGFQWDSSYGLCVDVDECVEKMHNCDQRLESCVNLVGSYRCACKWGHTWNVAQNKCVTSAVLELIKLGKKEEANKANNVTILTKIGRFLFRTNGGDVMLINGFNLIIAMIIVNIFC